MRYLHLFWRNLTRKKTRTIFTFLSIAVAFFLFGLLIALKGAFDAGVEIAGEDRLLTIHKVSIIQLLPLRYLNQIENTPGVASATHANWFGGIYQDPKNFFAQWAVQPRPFMGVYPEYEMPDDQLERWEATRTGAIAGRALVDRFGWEIGDRIPLQATFYRPRDGNDIYEFDLVGIYDGATPDVDETQFFFQYDYLMERVGDIGQVGWYIVQLEEPERAVEIAEAIDAQFANSAAETRTSTEKAFMQGFAAQIGDTGKILMSIVAIVFFVILLIAGNTMAQSVRERTSEVGVLKTLGFSDTGVMGLVLGESVLLALSAGVAGLTLVYLAVPGIRGLVEDFLPVFYISGSGMALGVAIAALLGLTAGALPAWSAMRLRIVDALRRT